MKINENWRIDTDGEGCTLIFSEKRIRKDGKNKGEEFTFEEPYYYPTVKSCLVAYLNKSLEDSQDVKDCLSKIKIAEQQIKNMII